MLETKTDRGV